MCSDTAWSIPCCAAVSASISVEGPLSAAGAPLCELGDDDTEGRAEESGAAGVKTKKRLHNVTSYQLLLIVSPGKPGGCMSAKDRHAMLFIAQDTNA